ncbi:MAG: adenosylcobinamide-GDP ribazoletransferase [Raineya sp.]
MFRHEIAVFLSALMFYTRLPVPSIHNFKDEYLHQATRYFPLIGWIVGALGALTYVLCSYFFPPEITISLCLIVGVLATGAFHEDGFADVCDGFGGGWTKEKILEIMKDSRVGVFAVVGLLLIFLLKFHLLTELSQKNIFVSSVFFAQVLSRWFALTFISSTPYSRADEQSKIKPIAKEIALKDFAIATIIAFATFLLFPSWHILGVFLVLAPLKIYLRYFFLKWIHGYTGDCLGAAQQISEVCIYLYLVANL